MISLSSFCFAVHLLKIPQEKKYSRKWISSLKKISEWSNCVSVCADGAPAMMGSNKGFMSFVKRKNNNISVVHCLLHRENLATKEIQENLAIVFKEVVSVVNYIKSRPLNTRLFHALCDKMGAELSGLLFHSTACWLS